MGKATKAVLLAILVSVVVTIFGWLGLSINQTNVEDAISEITSEYTVQDDSLQLIQTAEVTQVIDGDTLTVRIGDLEETVRLLGIDAPETEFSPAGKECFSSEATTAAAQLVEGKVVTLLSDSSQDLYDTYGRRLAYVEIGETDLGLELVSRGYAKEFTFRVPYERQTEYRIAEADAEAAGRGLWSACTN